METKIKNYKFTISFEKISNQGVSAEKDLKDNALKEYDLKESLDRVQTWINNVDQKAGILLATEGVILTVIFTTGGAAGKIIELISFKGFSFTTLSTWSGFFCVLALVAVLFSLYKLLCAISAKIDPEEFKAKNPNLITNSMFHFYTIANRSYEKFRSEAFEDGQKTNDYRSQVYINSLICTKKFKSYNWGLYAFETMLVCSVLTFIFSIISA